jgi:hypothetical protein
MRHTLKRQRTIDIHRRSRFAFIPLASAIAAVIPPVFRCCQK